MYPTDPTPVADPTQTPGPAQPAAPDPAPQPDPAATTSTPASSPSTNRQPGDFVNIRYDNGRGTVVEQEALVVRSVDVPDVKDGQQQDTTHVEYDVVPVTTMRVSGDHLVDDEG